MAKETMIKRKWLHKHPIQPTWVQLAAAAVTLQVKLRSHYTSVPWIFYLSPIDLCWSWLTDILKRAFPVLFRSSAGSGGLAGQTSPLFNFADVVSLLMSLLYTVNSLRLLCSVYNCITYQEYDIMSLFGGCEWDRLIGFKCIVTVHLGWWHTALTNKASYSTEMALLVQFNTCILSHTVVSLYSLHLHQNAIKPKALFLVFAYCDYLSIMQFWCIC